jgi:hypothetical protein
MQGFGLETKQSGICEQEALHLILHLTRQTAMPEDLFGVSEDMLVGDGDVFRSLV